MKDGGPALSPCRSCGVSFIPKAYQVANADYECPQCKRNRQNAYNRSDPGFKEKRRKRNAQPRTRAYNASYQIGRVSKAIRATRRKVETEIDAGRTERKPCSVCGNKKVEAHHKNYGKPLDIIWLCRKHHVEEHAKQIPDDDPFAVADAMLTEREKERSGE